MQKPIQSSERKPFFVRFLEDQQLSSAAGGKPPQTLKYPSDNDEDGHEI